MAIRIRRANFEDAEFLAWVVLTASRSQLKYGLWDLIIGADEAGCLDYLRRLAIAEPRSLYHYDSFLIADVDGRPAAALCGFETRDGWAIVGEAMASVQRDLGWSVAQAVASSDRVAPVWTCLPEDAGADFGIENVATLPEYRRRGLVSVLIREILRETIQRGFRQAQIMTYAGNSAALSVYGKSGFSIRAEKHCPEVQKILGVPGFIQLTRDLKIT
jgi:translation initiation factor 4G